MNETGIATIVAIVSGLANLLGIPGITSQDLVGFMHVVTTVVSISAMAWAYVAHRKALGRALAGTY